MTLSATRVLVAPLDWGLGHATRSVPIIHYLREAGFEVILVADGRPYDFLSRRFPDLKIIRCSGYDISYPKSDQFMVHMAKSGPRIAKALREERKSAERIAEETGAEIIISDNRLNFRSDKTKNIFITHQLRVKAGLFTLAASALHRKFYSKFDEVWIPDNAGKENLSGDLAFMKRPKKNYRYIGPLTRFSIIVSKPTPFDLSAREDTLLFLLSGPEPQRTIFEDLILRELKLYPVPALILRGQPGQPHRSEPLPGVIMINHMDDEKLAEVIRSSSVIVSRGGYSTLCDLAMSSKKLICVPTPGQTEQEYLADYHMKRGQMVSMRQEKFSLEEALNMSVVMQPFYLRGDSRLKAAINEL